MLEYCWCEVVTIKTIYNIVKMVNKRQWISQCQNVENDIIEAILKEIDVEVKAQKRLKTSERAKTFGFVNTILKRHKTANPWLSRDKLNNYKRSIAHKITINMKKKTDSVSSLTANSEGYETGMKMHQPLLLEVNVCGPTPRLWTK